VVPKKLLQEQQQALLDNVAAAQASEQELKKVRAENRQLERRTALQVQEAEQAASMFEVTATLAQVKEERAKRQIEATETERSELREKVVKLEKDLNVQDLAKKKIQKRAERAVEALDLDWKNRLGWECVRKIEQRAVEGSK
jgi:hypothetical protein